MNCYTIYKQEYPFLLQQVSRQPDQLHISGEMPDDSYKFLCVIGSRSHSSYGEDACRQLILGLSGFPIVIVSGLAVGIDSIAHQVAIDAGLKTIAFPGSGLSHQVLYPSNRRSLAKKIVENGGALVSPFDYEQEGKIWTFPTRNRLMAAVSHATLVIESMEGSGSIGTARNANEFGRDVLVVPGSIFSELSKGNHMLLREGATAVTSSMDILEALNFDTLNMNGETRIKRDYSFLNLSPAQKQIVGILNSGSANSSILIEKTKLSPSELNVLLSELELYGVIKESGGHYRLI